MSDVEQQKPISQMTDAELEAAAALPFDADIDEGAEIVGDEPTTNEDNPVANGDTKGAESPDGTQQAKTTTDEDSSASEGDAAGVLAKDGKHVLPFSVLEVTRKRAADLEARIKEQAEQMELLKAQAKGSTVEAPQDVEMFTEEQLAAMEEDGLGSMAQTFRSVQEVTKNLRSELNALKSKQAAIDAERAEVARAKAQEHVDANPKMVLLQETDAESFGQVNEIIRAMVTNPKTAEKWGAMTPSERIESGLKIFETAYGEIELKNALALQGNTTAAPPEKASAAPLKAKTLRPTTLSDLPGGEVSHPSSLRDRLLNMTDSQRIAWMRTAKPEELDQVYAFFPQ
jgi:hypothetical protein